jgi:hypothetical protein
MNQEVKLPRVEFAPPHPVYNTRNFPTLVCNHGNWDIYKNDWDRCAAIPTKEGAAIGCKATHFGDMAYVKGTLPVQYAAWEERQGKLPEVQIPRQVEDRVKSALNRLREQEAALRGVQLVRGNGHILALELSDRDAKIREGMARLDEFRALAVKNGVDGEAFINECGGVPDFERYGYVPR